MFSICFIRYCTFFLWAPLVEPFDSYGVQGGKLIKLNTLYKVLCIVYHLNLNQSINQFSTLAEVRLTKIGDLFAVCAIPLIRGDLGQFVD